MTPSGCIPNFPLALPRPTTAALGTRKIRGNTIRTVKEAGMLTPGFARSSVWGNFEVQETSGTAQNGVIGYEELDIG